MNNITCIYNPNKKNYETECPEKISIDELNTIPNGSIKHIYCEILDSIDFDNREKLQSEILKKVMVDGTIYLRLLNSTLLAKKIIRQEIDLKTLNDVIFNTFSIIDNSTIISWMESQTNFAILKHDIDNIFSNIVIKRIK